MEIGTLEDQREDEFIKLVSSTNWCTSGGKRIDDITNNAGSSLLMMASASKNFSQDTALLLIRNGANVNLLNNYGESALSSAARIGTKETVQLLLENGAEVNTLDKFGRTPLSYAVRGLTVDSFHKVKLLIDYHADLNAGLESNQTPMKLALGLRSTRVHAIVALLLKSGAPLEYPNRPHFSSMLMASIRYPFLEIAMLLIYFGANISEYVHLNTLAVPYDELEIYLPSQLYTYEESEQYYVNQYSSPLIAAVNGNHVEIVRKLLARGAKVDSKYYIPTNTPLFVAVKYGYMTIVNLILKYLARITPANRLRRKYVIMRRTSADAIEEKCIVNFSEYLVYVIEHDWIAFGPHDWITDELISKIVAIN